MESTKWFRVILMGILIGSLGVPPGADGDARTPGAGPANAPAARVNSPATTSGRAAEAAAAAGPGASACFHFG